MAGLEAFNELPLKQRIGIIAGVGVFIALIFSYLLYDALGTLGPAEDNLLSPVLRVDAEESIWGEIVTLREAARVDWAKGKFLEKRKKTLDDLHIKINKSRELLPTESQKGKITQEITDFAAQINARNLCDLQLSGISISQQRSKARRRGKKVKTTATKTMYRCELSGNINGIISFIESVESYESLFMTVDGIKLKPGKITMMKDEMYIDKGLHSVTVEVNTWVLPE